MSAEWWRDYRRRNRERLNAQRNARRARDGRGDRSAEYAKRAATRTSRAAPPIPPLHVGHPIFDQARAVVGARRTTLRTLYDPLYDDLVSEAVVALLEGADPAAAVAEYRTRELRIGRMTAPILGDLG